MKLTVVVELVQKFLRKEGGGQRAMKTKTRLNTSSGESGTAAAGDECRVVILFFFALECCEISFLSPSPLTWNASLFLRCRLLSLSSVFCFSSSSSFSSARMCSSKQTSASSLSISVGRRKKKKRPLTVRHQSQRECARENTDTHRQIHTHKHKCLFVAVLWSSSSSAKVGLSNRYCCASDQVVR